MRQHFPICEFWGIIFLQLLVTTMYLRRHSKKSGGIDYETWTLVESERMANGLRQRIVDTVGKLPVWISSRSKFDDFIDMRD